MLPLFLLSFGKGPLEANPFLVGTIGNEKWNEPRDLEGNHGGMVKGHSICHSLPIAPASWLGLVGRMGNQAVDPVPILRRTRAIHTWPWVA